MCPVKHTQLPIETDPMTGGRSHVLRPASMAPGGSLSSESHLSVESFEVSLHGVAYLYLQSGDGQGLFQ